LELVNRETGFNKVFNSSANVGVINPLIKVVFTMKHKLILFCFESRSLCETCSHCYIRCFCQIVVRLAQGLALNGRPTHTSVIWSYIVPVMSQAPVFSDRQPSITQDALRAPSLFSLPSRLTPQSVCNTDSFLNPLLVLWVLIELLPTHRQLITTFLSCPQATRTPLSQ
ncbi:hypothetical protein GOODEAATRI_006176, partial [Goodea atripinnis]